MFVTLLSTTETATSGGVVALIVGSICTMIAAVAASVFSFLGHREAKGANSAVNHIPKGGDRLFDMVAETRNQVKAISEWKSKWDGLPEDIGSAEKLVTQFKVIEDRIETSTDTIFRRLSTLDTTNALQHSIFQEELAHHIKDSDEYRASTGKTLADFDDMIKEVREDVRNHVDPTEKL